MVVTGLEDGTRGSFVSEHRVSGVNGIFIMVVAPLALTVLVSESIGFQLDVGWLLLLLLAAGGGGGDGGGGDVVDVVDGLAHLAIASRAQVREQGLLVVDGLLPGLKPSLETFVIPLLMGAECVGECELPALVHLVRLLDPKLIGALRVVQIMLALDGASVHPLQIALGHVRGLAASGLLHRFAQLLVAGGGGGFKGGRSTCRMVVDVDDRRWIRIIIIIIIIIIIAGQRSSM